MSLVLLTCNYSKSNLNITIESFLLHNAHFSEYHAQNFRALGSIHQARWMSKIQYNIKVQLFQSQLKLTHNQEANELHDIKFFLEESLY